MENSGKISDSIHKIEPHIEQLVAREQSTWDAACSIKRELRNYDIEEHTLLWVCALSKLYHICGGPNDKAEEQLFWMTGEFLERANHGTIFSTDNEHTALLSRFNFILENYARLCLKRKDESAIVRMTNLIEKSGQKRVNVLLVVTVNVLFKLTEYQEITKLAQKNSISNLVSIDADTLTQSNVLEFYYQLGISFFIQALHTQAHEYFCYASCMMKRDTPFEFEKRLLLSASINAFLWQTDQFYANDEIFAKHFDSFLRKIPIRHVFCEVINCMKDLEVARVVSLISQEDFSQVVPQVDWTVMLKRVVKNMRIYKLKKVLSDFDAIPVAQLAEYDDIGLHEAQRLEIQDTLEFVSSNISSFPDFAFERSPEPVLQRRDNQPVKENSLDLDALTQKNFAMFETIESLESMTDQLKRTFYENVSAL